MFTRSAYKQILAARNETHPNAPNNNHKVAITQCRYNGIGRSLTWPISLPMHFSLLQITKQAEVAEQDRIAKAETARILAEYNRDPVEEEFKKLEEDEKKKEQLKMQQEYEAEAAESRKYWQAKVKELEAKVDQLPKQLDFTNYNLTHNTTHAYENREYYTDTNKRVVSSENKLGNPVTQKEANRLIDLYKKEIDLLQGLKKHIDNEYNSGKSTALYRDARMQDVQNRLNAIATEVQILHSRVLMSRRDNVF